jgi:hypothetical protein
VNSGLVEEMVSRTRVGFYSYGDSAGIKPDFPFNEFCITQFSTVMQVEDRMIYFLGTDFFSTACGNPWNG